MVKTKLAGWKFVYKDGLPPYFASKLKSDLTFENPEYRGMALHRPKELARLKALGEAPPRELKFFGDFGDLYAVPRGYDMSGIPQEVDDQRVRVPTEYPEPRKELWGIQREAIDAVFRKKADCGVIIIPTGSGKTILGLEIARRLGQRLLILTNRDETGIDSWVTDAKDYLGLDIGVIKGGRVEHQGRQIVAATFQTLWSQRDLMDELSRQFGIVLVDETHRVPATTFHHVTNAFHARYRYGLTATDQRNDGLAPMIFHTMGPVLFERRQSAKIVPVGVRFVRTGILMPEVDNAGGDYNKCLRHLTSNAQRNDLIARKVVEYGGNSWVLVVTHRVNHAKTLANMIARRVGAENVGVMIGSDGPRKGRFARKVDLIPGIERNAGKVKKAARDGEIRYVVATIQFVKEGLNIKRWDMLFLATPTSNEIELIQCIGRIRRGFPGKEKGIVYDFVDPPNWCHRKLMARKRIYGKLADMAEHEKVKPTNGKNLDMFSSMFGE